MKKVFLDTNILLDYGLEREKADYAGAILEMGQRGMMQYQCAKAAGCDVIVTNNKKDFQQFCELPFLTSEEFLLQLD